MRGQAGTPAITWPVIDTGQPEGAVPDVNTERPSLPDAAAADVASQGALRVAAEAPGHVTQAAASQGSRRLRFFCDI